MPASFNDVSHELVDLIFQFVPRKSLASVSSVCRSWHSISLPLLYHSVDLGSGSRADVFIKRVLQELDVADGMDESSNGGQHEGGKEGVSNGRSDTKCRVPSSLTSYVRRISVGPLLDEGDQVANLAKALSKLKNLEHLHLSTLWMESSASVWHDILVLLHESLPKLNSLSLVLTGEEFPLGNSDKVVALTNIRELVIRFEGSFDLEFDDDFEQESEVPEVIVDLIRGASNIQSLSLSFQEDEESPRPKWVPSALFSDSALSRAQFPNLRTFRSYALELVPVDFYDRDSTFRRFFQSHPNLHTVELDLSAYYGGPTLRNPPQITMTPETVVGLMPSVQHFEGPCVLVEALLKSNLAQQLHTLVIKQAHPEMLGDFKDLLQVIRNLGTPLPRLKKFEIHSDTVTCDATLIGLSTFALGMPQLEEWIIDGELPTIRENRRVVYPPANWNIEQCLESLKHLPHLRILALSQIPGLKPKNNAETADYSFLLRVGEVCPRLESVHDAAEGDQWAIVRRDGLPVDVIYLHRYLANTPFWWDDEE